MTKWIAALVVEDDALVRFDVAQTLEAQGYATFEAADAEEAIAVLEAKGILQPLDLERDRRLLSQKPFGRAGEIS